jgi:transketolase
MMKDFALPAAVTPASPTLSPALRPQVALIDLLHPEAKKKKITNEETAKSDEMVISCIRSLAMDMVQKAGSGHPGTPMAMAPVGYALWARVLNYDPREPMWMNRDRFVLSMGHASALLYGLLHVAGVREVDRVTERALPNGQLAVSLDDIKAFRQIGSKCPGHPEYGFTTGVEMTTGPLGQGVASSVGMAMASKWLAATFNREGVTLFDYDTYAVCGDGCLMEGVSSEAASLAGHLKLDNLCWIWDNNHITIDGNTAWATSEEMATRFIAYNWNVLRVGDANDIDALTRAFSAFKKEKERPTLIIVDSHIAWGSPSKQDHFSAHGTPLGKPDISATKKIYGWPDAEFLVPDELSLHFSEQMEARGGRSRRKWDALLLEYQKKYPEVYSKQLRHILDGTLPEGFDSKLVAYPADAKGLATRKSGSKCLNAVAQFFPGMIGGSADLAHSCLATLDFEGAGEFMPPHTGWGTYGGRNIHFGIREHAMGSVMNGLALCKLRPFGSTFLVFSDYMKPPVRMSAFMGLPCIWIFTHDSISVGEDGPTHQPIEQLSALRSIPNLLVFRPCDANETSEMWKHIALIKEEPVATVLSRQDLPTLDRSKYASAEGLHKGAYIVAGGSYQPELILMSSGSEVHLMLAAHEKLHAKGVKVRSLSVPSIGLFKLQSQDYINELLPLTCRARVSIEAGRRDQWASLVGLDGEHIGMHTFGESGPQKQVEVRSGFTADAVVTVAERVLGGKAQSTRTRCSSSDPAAGKRRRVCA